MKKTGFSKHGLKGAIYTLLLSGACLAYADDSTPGYPSPPSFPMTPTQVQVGNPSAPGPDQATASSLPIQGTPQAQALINQGIAQQPTPSIPAVPHDSDSSASPTSPKSTGSSLTQEQELQAFSSVLDQQTKQLQKTQQDQAFQSVVQQAVPLTPDQILQLKYLYSQTQRASEAPPAPPPVPTSTTETVNLAPGAVPPVVRLSQGFITSLVFVDATGAPWPIAAYDLGNPSAFNIQWDKTNNILMIQAKDGYTYANMAVKLQDLPTPVMVTLIPGQQVVDYRVDMRIRQEGPHAKAVPTGSGLPGQADPVLLGILDGVPPSGAIALKIQGGQAQAWQSGNKLLIRTRATLISPGWIATMSSADGTNAYLLQQAPTVLVSDSGALEQLSIKGFDVNGGN